MAELAVNIILLAAVLVAVVTWAASGMRRRRHERRERAEERRLVLHAALGAAAAPPPDTTARVVDGEQSAHAATRGGQPLDPGDVAALLDLLEQRRQARHGLFAGLVRGPSSVWAAGARAGQHVGRRTMGDRTEVRGDPDRA